MARKTAVSFLQLLISLLTMVVRIDEDIISSADPPSQADKQNNRRIASERVLDEHVIGKIKIFRIVSERYRNRRRRFGLRFNLIAGIYNFELGC